MMDIKKLVKNTYVTSGSEFEYAWKLLVDKTDLKIGFMPNGDIFCRDDCSVDEKLTEFNSGYIRKNCVNLKDFLESGKLLQRGDIWVTDEGRLKTVIDKDVCNRPDLYDDERYVIFSKAFLDEPEPEPEIAGVDRDGVEWTRGLVMVRDYDDQKWLPEVLISVETVETAQYLTKSMGHWGISWIQCRLPIAEELRPATCKRKYSKVERAAYELYKISYPDSETTIADAVKCGYLTTYKRLAIALNHNNCND